MTYFKAKKRDFLIPYERLANRSDLSAQLAMARFMLALERCVANAKKDSARGDYSEEAIPERDPAYRLPGGTDAGEPTIEAVSIEMRRELARRLEQLGMSTWRAEAVARL
jgi:hypothetical protein